MREVVQHLQTLEHDGVRSFALDADDETDAAGVMLVCGIIEALCWWNGAVDLHRHALFVSPTTFFTTAWRWRLPLPTSACDSSLLTEICVRSVWVESTTIVSVRVTPSISRIVR